MENVAASSSLSFRAALDGANGALSAWLERSSEQETRAHIERLIQECREACAIAAWSAGMDEHNRLMGMPSDAREVGSQCAKSIRGA